MARAKRQLSFTIQLRLLLALMVAAVVIVLLPGWVHLPTRLLSAWDAATICLLAMSWWIMLRATPDSMRRKSQQQDASRWVILSLITAAACVSVLAIAVMLRDNKHASPTLLAIHLSLAILTIVGSW